MSVTALKNKIQKSIDAMDEIQLRSAWLILKEIADQKKYEKIKVDKNVVNDKIAAGINQLNNGEGTDFKLFLNEIQEGYGKKK
jgi:hypothetical protein